MASSNQGSAPTAGHDQSAESAPGGRTRPWWREPATIIPIVVSIVAVVFTGATYWDQHQADREQSSAAVAAAAAVQEADAKLVSYSTESGNTQVVVVQNLSQQPIYDTTLDGWVRTSSEKQVYPIDLGIWLGQLPPCTDTHVYLTDPRFLAKAIQAMYGAAANSFTTLTTPWKWQTKGLVFTDGNGLSWILQITLGQPSRAIYQYPTGIGTVIPQPTPPMRTTTAAGCS